MHYSRKSQSGPEAIWTFVVILGLISLLAGCKPRNKQAEQAQPAAINEALMGANTLLLETEQQEIADFIARYGWDMKQTGSGLFYQIYHHGQGPKAEKGAIARIDYSIYLLTGDRVYSSQEDGVRDFRIGRGGVELGLEEGILLLHQGDKARFIMPAHLAHGVPGDGVMIPRRAAIVYDLELIDLQ